MQAKLDRAGNVYRVTVRGNVGDARPFSKLLGPSTTTGARSGGRDQRELDLDIALNILTGFNDEAITKADLKGSIRGGNLRQFQMTGRLGSSNLIAQTVTQGGQPAIVMQVDDAGAMLRFLDIYRRMEGGRMQLQMAGGDGPQVGTLTVNAFALRNEPALRRIIPTQSQSATGSDANGRPVNVNIDLNEVTFTKARAEFVRSSGRLDFREAAIWGPAVGFTLDGYIDFARDRTDVSGTFVPAYGLNNMFAQVPLLGAAARRRAQRGPVRRQFPPHGTGRLAAADGEPALRHRARRVPQDVRGRQRRPRGPGPRDPVGPLRLRRIGGPAEARRARGGRCGSAGLRRITRRAGGRASSCRTRA
jgi:hypothetical protein